MKRIVAIILTAVLICCYFTGFGENAAQNLPETWKQELALADEMGIRTDCLDQATISGKEMMAMLDKLVAYAAPDRVDQWMSQYEQLRTFDKELKRFDAMGMCYKLSEYRYPDETIEAFLTDMAKTMKEKGYGWCYGASNSNYAVFCYAPCVAGAEYEQVGPYALYKDVMMTKIFQRICAE